MQWQRLLGSAAVVAGCASAASLWAADPPAAGKDVTQTSLAVAPGRVVASARALVNGVPILDDEVTQAALPSLVSLSPASPTYESDVKKIKAAALEALIERELLVQEAKKGLVKANRKDVLEKVDEEADAQLEHTLKQLRATFPTDEAFRKFLQERGTSPEEMKRQKRRQYLAEQYLHESVRRQVDRATGHQEVYDYYRAHPEEFQRADSVQWQDIFIDAGNTKKYATRADAYRTAQELQARAKAGGTEDFVRLCQQYDDGLNKTRKGAAGFGTRRQDISPPEAAPVLFRMSDGDVGPIVSVPAGYHVLRLVKRTHAGMAPFDDEVQKAIRDKLRNEVYAREQKRFLDELKQSAHIERMP
jgi:parvulin-like peptidyl-prolyl isomerase